MVVYESVVLGLMITDAATETCPEGSRLIVQLSVYKPARPVPIACGYNPANTHPPGVRWNKSSHYSGRVISFSTPFAPLVSAIKGGDRMRQL